MLTAALNGKRLELLHELVPKATTVAALVNPNNVGAPAVEREIDALAPSFGFEPLIVRASNETEIDAAFATLAERKIGALVVANDAFFNSRRAQLVGLSTRHALPTIFEWREFAALGGLMSYGTDISDVLRQLGGYAARVFKGAKPADLPVLQPTRFELVINEPTARTLGLTIPPSLQLRAEVLR
jgi:putative ABC transport system substrate-binding protein